LIVVDTNILVGLLLPGDVASTAACVYAKDPDWIAPPLLRSEFRNVLATLARHRVINSDSALLIMEEAERILDGNEFPVNSTDVLALAGSSACSAYDCEYVALARMLRLPFITLDREVLASFPKIAADPEKFVNSI
jgi:predicted nucleic acid-binding protein